MSLLKRIGQILLTATRLVREFGPAVAISIPGEDDDRIIGIVSDKLDIASDVIIQAELFGQSLELEGSDKAKMATASIFQILMSMKVVAGKKLKDEAAARAAAEALGGSLADFLNAFED